MTAPASVSSSSAMPSSSSFEALPRYVAASVLSYAASTDWLQFRLASRSSYAIVHGPQAKDDASSFVLVGGCGDEESESLWRLALVRDYGFDEEANGGDGDGDDEDSPTTTTTTNMRRSIRIDPESDSFLSAKDAFDAESSFESWKHWRKIDVVLHRDRTIQGSCIPTSERVVGPYFLRAASMWRKIERWCLDQDRSKTLGSEILSSLSPGRTLDPNSRGRIVPRAETSALKAVYSFYSGQHDPAMHSLPGFPRGEFNPFTGLFGGFSAYHVVSNTRWTEPEFGGFGRPEQMPLGGGERPFLVISHGESKAVTMDLRSGQVYFLYEGEDASRLPATPHDEDTDGRDSILRWFEEHADRLHRNHYAVGGIDAGGSRTFNSLLRYPTSADEANCGRAVTRGVEVVASAIHVPEMGVFVYSIRIRLLSPEDGEGYESPEERGFESCQLVSRHWRVGKQVPNRNPIEHRVEEVRGEGVVGAYPLLREGRYVNYEDMGRRVPTESERGRGYFSYQSCTNADLPGFLEGSLQFRPGSLREPTGDVFDVRVARFPFNFSRFLY